MKYRMLQNCFIRLSLFRYFLMQCSIISFMCTLIRVYWQTHFYAFGRL